MGSECSPDEREFRYRALYEAIHTIDNDIKEELKNTNIQSKKYSTYGLLNKDLCRNYSFLMNNIFDSKEARNKVFNYKDLIKKNEERNYNYIHDKFEFNFPTDFIFISKDFLDVMNDYVNKEIKPYLKTNFEFIIGGGCLLKKNINKSSSDFLSSFTYITLYNELNEKQGNYTDFFLFINNKNKRESTINFILQNNIWNYFNHIKYDYKNEYKKIIDKNNQEIGYIVRVSDVKMIDSFVSRMKQKEQNEIELSVKQLKVEDQPKNVIENINFRNNVNQIQNIVPNNMNKYDE